MCRRAALIRERLGRSMLENLGHLNI
jgi:hypothetical protein